MQKHRKISDKNPINITAAKLNHSSPAMTSASVWLVSLVLCWGLPSPHTTLSSAAVYYVTPHTPNPDCPSGEPCLTINEYAQGNHFDGDDNITLLFLNGEHNLTAQNLVIGNKTYLKMVPSQAQSEVLITTNQTSTIIQNVTEAKISSLSFISIAPNRMHSTNETECLSVSDIGQLLVTSSSIDSCKLSLLGKMQATIDNLLATSNSSIYVVSSHDNQTTVIRNSEFKFSTLSVIDDSKEQIFANDISVNFLSIMSSLLRSSILLMKLKSPVIYELTILDTRITSKKNISTGIDIKVMNKSILCASIRNCSITRNSQGIGVTAHGDGYVKVSVEQCHITYNGLYPFSTVSGIGVMAYGRSRVELNVDKCYIAENGHSGHYDYSGGITVGSLQSVIHSTESCSDCHKHLFHYFRW